jgi:hypothetical protein
MNYLSEEAANHVQEHKKCQHGATFKGIFFLALFIACLGK